MNFRSVFGLLLFIALIGLNHKTFAQCAGAQSITVTPPFPPSGDCPPGQVYQFCYTMVGYNENGANWLDGFEIQFSGGWVPGSLNPLGPPANCNGGAGNWMWANTVTGTATGQTNGPGYFFDLNPDGNAGNDYGDYQGGGTCTWSFCFELTAGSTPGATLSAGVVALSDGAIGSWNSTVCGLNPPPFTSDDCIIGVPCGTISSSVVQHETCPGDADGEATGSMTNGTAPYTYSWNTVPVQTTQNASGLTAGTYTISITDATGCVESSSVTINTGTPEDGTINNANATNTFCLSDAASQLTTVEPGGTFSGTGVSATGLFTPATAGAGTHTVSYTTSGPCPDTQTLDITVIQDADATITDPFDPANPTNTLCINDPAVQLTTTNTGGTWTGPGISATGMFDPLAAGVGTHNITYTIADPCGDSDVISITVSGSTDATINNINALNELCENDAPVQLTTVDPGGVFSGPGVNATGLFDPSLAGVGVATITYAIGGNCPDTQTLDINVLPVADASINNVNPTNTVGIGATPIQVSTVMAGGSFSGTGISPTGLFDPALAGPGTHTITYTIADPCGDVQTMDIIVVEITFTATGINLDCFNDFSGQILITNETGAGPHQYSSDGGATFNLDNPIVGLAAGTYSVVVMDNAGFLSEPIDVILTEPVQLTAVATMDIQSDCGQPNGEATVVGAGGSVALDYSYSWDSTPAQSSSTATGLLPQTYIVTVTDDNGCQATGSVSITSTPQISISIVSSADPLCFGGCDGQAEAICGGTAIPPFSYSWNDPSAQTTPIADDLCSGTYTVTGTDNVGCVATIDVTLVDPAPVEVSLTTDASPICIGQSANLLASTQGGLGPYSVQWVSTPADPTLVTNVPNPTVSPVVSTDYSIVVTDAEGCSSSHQSIQVEVHDPLSLIATRPTFTPDTAICPYDFATIDIEAFGGDGNYSFFLLPDLVTEVSFPMDVQPSETTTYDFMVSDGCTTPFEFLSSTITVHGLPTVNFTSDKVDGCQPLAVTFSDMTDPIPTSLAWNFGDPSSTQNTSPLSNPTHSFAASDSFDISLTATSIEGCVNDTVFSNYIVTHPLPVADFTTEPQRINLLLANIKMQDFSHDSITSWDWDFGDGESSDEYEPWHVYGDSGTYTVSLTVETVHGCTDYNTRSVVIEPDFMFYIPTAFTPNGDGDNDYFMAEGEGLFWDTFEMTIMNRWGNEIFHTANKDYAWDGSYGGHEAELGVYVYRITFMDLQEELKEYMGHVTLLR